MYLIRNIVGIISCLSNKWEKVLGHLRSIMFDLYAFAYGQSRSYRKANYRSEFKVKSYQNFQDFILKIPKNPGKRTEKDQPRPFKRVNPTLLIGQTENLWIFTQHKKRFVVKRIQSPFGNKKIILYP